MIKTINKLLFLSLLIPVLFSCTTGKTLILNNDYSPFGEFNYLAKHRAGDIVFNSGEVVKAKNMEIKGDSLSYNNPLNSDELLSADLVDVEKVIFKDHLIGLFDGALFGAVGGLGAGLLIVDRQTDMAGLAIGEITLGGIVVGGVIGAIIGRKIEYKIIPGDLKNKSGKGNK